MTFRIAIATDEGQVSQHFGRCQHYTLIDIDEGREIRRDEINCPPHEPGLLPGYLAEKNVNLVIAGGMGPRAQNLFQQKEIGVISGVSGSVNEALEQYLRGALQGGENLCAPGSGKGEEGGHCHD